jgi:hypothetical protein
MAIPDHPWTKATEDAAAVRIAMTVGEAGKREGLLREVISETATDTDTPIIEFAEKVGEINVNLTVGLDVTKAGPLKANEGICSPGMKLHGAGFIVSREEAQHLGLGRRSGLEEHIREYRNGRDLTARSRDVMVIDLFGLEEDEVRRRFPEVYQHVKLEVKEKVKINREGEKEYIGRDWNDRPSYKEKWWIFGEPRGDLRPALIGLSCYVITVETMQHRIFQTLDASILPDNRLIVLATDDMFNLGVLSSRIHLAWTTANGGTLEDRPVYTKSRCFDPFPFPDANNIQKQTIRIIAKDLDLHRKGVLAEHPRLTLTDLYNILEKLRVGTTPDELAEDERAVFDDGLVLILKELHDKLDIAVAEAYGWPIDLSDGEILAKLVMLNRDGPKQKGVDWFVGCGRITKFPVSQRRSTSRQPKRRALRSRSSSSPPLSKNHRFPPARSSRPLRYSRFWLPPANLSIRKASRRNSSEPRPPKRKSARCWPHWRGLATSRQKTAKRLRFGGWPLLRLVSNSVRRSMHRTVFR